MSKTRPLYPPEFRCQMVKLVRAGRNPEELARGLSPQPRPSVIGSNRPTETKASAPRVSPPGAGGVV